MILQPSASCLSGQRPVLGDGAAGAGAGVGAGGAGEGGEKTLDGGITTVGSSLVRNNDLVMISSSTHDNTVSDIFINCDKSQIKDSQGHHYDDPPPSYSSLLMSPTNVVKSPTDAVKSPTNFEAVGVDDSLTHHGLKCD